MQYTLQQLNMQRKLLTLTYFTIIIALLSGCSAKRILNKANKTYEIGEYDKASSYYRKALRRVKSQPQRAEIMFKQAECYRILSLNQFAANSYRAATYSKYPDSILYLRYAEVLADLGRTKEARDALEIYRTYDSTDIRIYNLRMSLDSASVWEKRPSRYIVNKVKIFESRASDFCPVYIGEDFDVVYFSSTRQGGISVKNSDITGMRPADFYMSRKDSKDEWTKPELVEGDLNTDDDEGVASATSDGKKLYFTVCRFEEGKAFGASVYASSRTGAQWGKPAIIPILSASTADSLVIAHPAINKSETELYFVSDMLGGYGGKDIWVVKKRGDKWGSPENLGPQINTVGNEMFPYIRSTGELYFSSDGRPTIGGLDIFRALKVEIKPENEDEEILTEWLVERMSAPVKSSGDDFGITFEGEREKGFFTSNRKNFRGNDNIYEFELPELQFILEGSIVDERDGTPLSDGRIKLVGNDGTNTIIRTKKDGTFAQELNKEADFVFLVTCRGYLNKKGEVSTFNLSENTNFNFDFELSSIKKPIRLNNILFAFNSSELNQTSKLSLDTLVEVLNDNPNITIELSAHTDMIGDDKVNMKLSEDRAASVMNYLITKGIAKDRLESKGYGKSQPVIADKVLASEYDFINEGDELKPQYISALPIDQQEICNQINRRTEFKVLSTNYKPGK